MHLTTRRYATIITFLAIASYLPLLHAQGRKPDPTFLHANANTAAEKPSDITTATCHYKPLFGDGASKFRGSGLVRYGEAIIDPKGTCTEIHYPPRRIRSTLFSTAAAPCVTVLKMYL